MFATRIRLAGGGVVGSTYHPTGGYISRVIRLCGQKWILVRPRSSSEAHSVLPPTTYRGALGTWQHLSTRLKLGDSIGTVS